MCIYVSILNVGGHYVPAWANAVNDHNENAATSTADKINLVGLVIGNGIVNGTVQSNKLYFEFLKSHDLIPADAHPLVRYI